LYLNVPNASLKNIFLGSLVPGGAADLPRFSLRKRSTDRGGNTIQNVTLSVR
jgi:hypothetical protein